MIVSDMFTTEADFERPDWPLIEWGAVNLFWNSAVLVEVQEQLQAIGYKVDRVNVETGKRSFVNRCRTP